MTVARKTGLLRFSASRCLALIVKVAAPDRARSVCARHRRLPAALHAARLRLRHLDGHEGRARRDRPRGAHARRASIAVDFTANPYFDAKVFYAKAPAEKALEAREVECILTIPAGFAANAQQGEGGRSSASRSTASTAIPRRSSRATCSGQLNSSVTKMVSNGMIESAVASRVSAGPVKVARVPQLVQRGEHLDLVPRTGHPRHRRGRSVHHDERHRDRAREWERGTMAAIFATPASPLEIFLAKWLSYWTIAFGSSLLSLCELPRLRTPAQGKHRGRARHPAHPDRHGHGAPASSSPPEVKNQFLAIELAVVLAYMPSLMLSGFLFDLRSVPVWIEFVGRLLPPPYAVEAFKQ